VEEQPQPGQPHWINLNIRLLSAQVISLIGAYEQELRTNPRARLSFHKKSARYHFKKMDAGATRIADALKSVPRKTHF
jgi:hypothetical protein